MVRGTMLDGAAVSGERTVLTLVLEEDYNGPAAGTDTDRGPRIPRQRNNR